MNTRSIVHILLLFATISATCQLQHTKDRSSAGKSSSNSANAAQELFKRVSPSVVVVEVFDEDHAVVGRGSGVMLESNRVITNRHVVDCGEIWHVRQGDKS